MNTKTNAHTPGPWKQQTLYPPMGGMVFEVNSLEGSVFKIRGGVCPTQQDARLIAAAPELLDIMREWLEAAAYIEKQTGHTPDNGSPVAKARALLARLES